MVGIVQYRARAERFLELFNQGLTRAEIRQALDITSAQYDGIRRQMQNKWGAFA